MVQSNNNDVASGSVGSNNSASATNSVEGDTNITDAAAAISSFYGADSQDYGRSMGMLDGGHLNLFKVGQRVFYIDGEEKAHKARIAKIDYDDQMHTYYTIEVNGTQKDDVHHVDLSLIHPTVDKVLGVINLRDETVNYLRETCPTLKEFEKFLKLSFEAVKAFHKTNGELKEPRFKRSDREAFIILCRWTEKYQVEGRIGWGYFNEENFNDFCEQAPKEDLFEILKELGIYNQKVVNTLDAKSIQSPAHFIQKPMSWYAKLCEEEQGTEENIHQHQSKNLLLSGIDKTAIQKFKEWYIFHFIGYFPSDWIVSFRNDDVHPKERDLRKVLRVIGLNADAIEVLRMNDIKDIATLNRMSKNWRTESRIGLYSMAANFSGMGGGEQESRSNEWKDMGLSRNDASDIISFRHWHKFYVAGKSNMKGWTKEFNSAQYNNFLQRYEPGDDFSNPSRLKFWMQDSLKFSQERHDYFDMLQKAAESGDVTDEQRYHYLKYVEKREKMSLIDEITSNHYEGQGDSTVEEDRLRELLHQDEEKADEKEEGDLLFGQQFYQFFFSAFLVLVLLTSWFGTTVYFMMQSLWAKNSEDYEQHAGFDYVTFIHNVLFGLVTAVVIQELGEEAAETSLYYRFLPTYREQRKRQREHRILNRKYASIWTGFRSLIVEGFKTYLMSVILWSTRLYIIFWICLGAASLAFGAIAGVDTSNPLYTTGQTWLGIAVTIGYTYFGLSGKNAPDVNDKIGQGHSQTDAVQGIQGITDASDRSNDKEEASFTNETEEARGRGSVAKNHREHINNTIDLGSKDIVHKGSIGGSDGEQKRKVVKTNHELMKEIDHYDTLLNEAISKKRFEDAAGHQKRLDQLDQLKTMFPTLAELESQLADVEENMKVAADKQDFLTAEKLHKDVARLKKKLKEEEDAAAGGDANPT